MSYAFRKQNWSTLHPWVTTDVPTLIATANHGGGIQISCHVAESWSTSHTNIQFDSIHNAGLRLALGAFCTSPVSSMYTEANEARLEERRLKLSMNYYLKTRACTDNPAHHDLHEFDPTTRDLYLSTPNGKGGMTRWHDSSPYPKMCLWGRVVVKQMQSNPIRPPIQTNGLKVEEALTAAKIEAEMFSPLKIPSFPH